MYPQSMLDAKVRKISQFLSKNCHFYTCENRSILRRRVNIIQHDELASFSGVNIFQICMMILSMITLCCAFDTAGRKWVKMKKYQESMKEKTHRSRRSGSARRNWRQRLVVGVECEVNPCPVNQP